MIGVVCGLHVAAVSARRWPQAAIPEILTARAVVQRPVSACIHQVAIVRIALASSTATFDTTRESLSGRCRCLLKKNNDIVKIVLCRCGGDSCEYSRAWENRATEAENPDVWPLLRVESQGQIKSLVAKNDGVWFAKFFDKNTDPHSNQFKTLMEHDNLGDRSVAGHMCE